jgi:hypothetical protein
MLGLVGYVVVTWLIMWRALAGPFVPEKVTPDSWILMGALAVELRVPALRTVSLIFFWFGLTTWLIIALGLLHNQWCRRSSWGVVLYDAA